MNLYITLIIADSEELLDEFLVGFLSAFDNNVIENTL
jgi:hypothetical protein